MKTIARKRSKVKKKASSKKKTPKKTARRITRTAKKKVAKKTSAKKKAAKKLSRKTAAVKKKKTAAKKKVIQRPIKRAKVAKKVTRRSSDITRPKKKQKAARKPVKRKKVRIKVETDLDRLVKFLINQKREELGLKPKIPRAVKKGKRRIVDKRGPLRAAVERMLSRPMAQAQMIERLEDKLPRDFFSPIKEWVETDESIIIQRLAMAEQVGVFDEEARENALEFDWDLRDVYELWHSPDVYF